MNYEVEKCVYDDMSCYSNCENCRYGYNRCESYGKKLCEECEGERNE